MLHTEFKPSSFVFLHNHGLVPCRCGMASLNESCQVCEQYVCQECAIFVDPATKQPTRPSHLIARRVRADFLAHRGCTSHLDQRTVPCVYNKDVPLMIQILKGSHHGIGRALR